MIIAKQGGIFKPPCCSFPEKISFDFFGYTYFFDRILFLRCDLKAQGLCSAPVSDALKGHLCGAGLYVLFITLHDKILTVPQIDRVLFAAGIEDIAEVLNIENWSSQGLLEIDIQKSSGNNVPEIGIGKKKSIT